MLSLIQALERYLDYCRLEEQSARTIEGKQHNLQLFVRWYITHHGFNIRDLTMDGIQDFIRYLHEYREPQNKRLICRATRRNKITAVRMFCRYLFPAEHIGINFADKIKTPKVGKSITQAILQPDEVAAIARQTAYHGEHGIRDSVILAVFFSCGLRRNDITTLTLKSINEQAKLIFVAQSKGRQDRIVPIAAEAIKLVTYYRDVIRPKLMNFSSGDYLFLNNRGMQYTGGQITELISKYKRRAGVSKPGASNLYRHTTATTLLDNGADLLTVQKVLGHASVSTTQIYTHVAVRKMSDDYQKFHPAVQNPDLYIPFNHPINQPNRY